MYYNIFLNEINNCVCLCILFIKDNKFENIFTQLLF